MSSNVVLRKHTGAVRLSLRGGEGDGLFDKLDSMMISVMGKNIWGVLKSALGLSDTRVKRTVEQDLLLTRLEMQAEKVEGKQDRKMLYYLSEGPFFFANPFTWLLRHMRSTEEEVRTAILYLQVNQVNMTVPEMKKILAKPGPKGFGMTPARINEAVFRSAVDTSKEEERRKAAEKYSKEEDKELKEFKEDMLRRAEEHAKKTGEYKTENFKPKLHKLATKKWTGTAGNVVKRLQKELIQIQSTGSFEVELVKDNIFEWWVTIEGAKDSFYEGEKFILRFAFDSQYPTEPPEVSFVVRVPGWPLPETGTKNATGNCPSQRKGGEWPKRWGVRKHHCPIHPHIYTNGHICLSIIYDDWSPALGVEAVCHSMVSMMSSAKEKEPPADNTMHLDSGTTSAKDVKGWDFHDHEA